MLNHQRVMGLELHFPIFSHGFSIAKLRLCVFLTTLDNLPATSSCNQPLSWGTHNALASDQRIKVFMIFHGSKRQKVALHLLCSILIDDFPGTHLDLPLVSSSYVSLPNCIQKKSHCASHVAVASMSWKGNVHPLMLNILQNSWFQAAKV